MSRQIAQGPYYRYFLIGIKGKSGQCWDKRGKIPIQNPFNEGTQQILANTPLPSIFRQGFEKPLRKTRKPPFCGTYKRITKPVNKSAICRQTVEFVGDNTRTLLVFVGKNFGKTGHRTAHIDPHNSLVITFIKGIIHGQNFASKHP